MSIESLAVKNCKRNCNISSSKLDELMLSDGIPCKEVRIVALKRAYSHNLIIIIIRYDNKILFNRLMLHYKQHSELLSKRNSRLIEAPGIISNVNKRKEKSNGREGETLQLYDEELNLTLIKKETAEKISCFQRLGGWSHLTLIHRTQLDSIVFEIEPFADEDNDSTEEVVENGIKKAFASIHELISTQSKSKDIESKYIPIENCLPKSTENEANISNNTQKKRNCNEETEEEEKVNKEKNTIIELIKDIIK